MSSTVCPGCIDGSGWILIEHPMRPGVIMQNIPCYDCNEDRSKPDPFQKSVITWYRVPARAR